MRKYACILLVIVFVFIFMNQSYAGIIDWDRKMGLRRVEGVVVSVDKRNNQVIVKNNANGRNATYQAASDLLADLFGNEKVLLKYKKGTDIAHSIEKR